MTEDATRGEEREARTAPEPAGAAASDSAERGGAQIEGPQASAAPEAPAQEERRPRTSRTRWIVAGIAAASVVAFVVVAAILLTSRTAPPAAYAYVPAGAQVVAELRPELSGDQRANIGELLSHFPGFADQSILDTKIDEALNRIIDRLSGQDVDYVHDVKPYLAGPVVVATTGPGATTPAAAGLPDGIVVVLSTNGAVGCGTLGAGSTTTTHAGHAVVLVDDATLGQVACSQDGSQLVVGREVALDLALDTHAAKTGIDRDPAFTAAAAAVPADRLAFAYVSKAALLGSTAVGQAASAIDPSVLPDWLGVTVRAEGDGLVADALVPEPAAAGASPTPSVAPTDSFPTLGPAKASTLAQHLPATTVAAFEQRSTGVVIRDLLGTASRLGPTVAPAVDQVRSAFNLVGGLDSFLEWIGDATVVVTKDGGAYGGGLVIETGSAEPKAKAKLDQLVAFLRFAGAASGFTVSDAPYGAGTVTTIGVSRNVIAGQLSPEQAAILPERIDVSYTTQGGLAVFGIGDRFVKSVVDTKPGSSLADQARYARALQLAGATNTGQVYLDIPAVVDPIVASLDPTNRALYEREYKPYVTPLDAVALTAGRDGPNLHLRLAFAVRDTRTTNQ